MNKVVHRNESFWGSSSVIVLAGGFALAMVSVLANEKSAAIIHDLMVHESRRGRGLGRKLLKEAIAEAEGTGAEVTRIAVEPCSWQAEWYKRNGFREVGSTELDSHECLVLERENPSGDGGAGNQSFHDRMC